MFAINFTAFRDALVAAIGAAAFSLVLVAAATVPAQTAVTAHLGL